MLKKFKVIANEQGEVVGTQLDDDNPDSATGMMAALTAGPGQTLHHVEFEVPHLARPLDIAEFHKKLTQHLRRQR